MARGFVRLSQDVCGEADDHQHDAERHQTDAWREYLFKVFAVSGPVNRFKGPSPSPQSSLLSGLGKTLDRSPGGA